LWAHAQFIGAGEIHIEGDDAFARAIEQTVLNSPEVVAMRWISVDERLPEPGQPSIVFSPPRPEDWPDSVRIEFDWLDPECDDPVWFNHSEHYEHYCRVAKGGADCPIAGPSEKAPYTHWMPLPAPPK